MKSLISVQLEVPANDTLVSLDELIRVRGEARKRFEDAVNTSDRKEAAAARGFATSCRRTLGAHQSWRKASTITFPLQLLAAGPLLQ